MTLRQIWDFGDAAEGSVSGPPGGPLEAITPACERDRGWAVDNLPFPVEDVWASGTLWG